MNELDPKFCLVPFTSFSISPRGIIRPCCNQYEKPMHTEWENVKDAGDTIPWPTPKLIAMQEIMRGTDIEEKTPACRLCWGSEKIGLPSYRTRFNEFMIKRIGIDKAKQLKDTPHINTLDVQFGHLCNNSCLMCNASLSSHLYATKGRLAKMSTDPKQIEFYQSDIRYINDHGDWPQDDEYYNKLLELCKPITEIKISGGEPLFNPRFKEFLNYLINKELPLSHLHLTTNGTIYDDEIAGLINKIKGVAHIKLSVESLGAAEEFIRWPTDWKEKEKNIKSFISNIHMPQRINIEISTCIQSLNLFTMFDVSKFIEKLKLECSDKVKIIENRQPIMNNDIASLAHCDNGYLNHYLNQANKNEQPADIVNQVKRAIAFNEKRTKTQVHYYVDSARLQQKNLEELFPVYWQFHKDYV